MQEDIAWKDILERFFPQFLEFFFPEIHRDIDWSRGYESLDKELQPILLEAEIGKQLVDMLMKVYIFPVVKILDYGGRREELERSGNPFSLVVLTHLDARTAKDDGERFDVKFNLVRRLYRKGYGREDVVALLRFIDWLVRIPKDLDRDFREKVKSEIEGVTNMPYLTSWERDAMEKGLREGLVEAVAFGLKLRFGNQGLTFLPQVRRIEKADQFRALLEAIPGLERIEEFSSLLKNA